MDRFPSDHARNFFSSGIEYVDFNAGQGVFVDAADGTEEDEPAFINVDDLKTDFIVMAGQHDFEFRIGIEHGDGISRDVGPDLVGEAFRIVAECRCRFEFESGRAGAGHESLQKIQA